MRNADTRNILPPRILWRYLPGRSKAPPTSCAKRKSALAAQMPVLQWADETRLPGPHVLQPGLRMEVGLRSGKAAAEAALRPVRKALPGIRKGIKALFA